MALLLRHPTAGAPTTTLTLDDTLARVVQVQTTLAQQVHIAQGGKSFVFSPGATPVQHTIVPLELQDLPTATGGGFSGRTDLRAFLLTTLLGSQGTCDLTDPDGDTYRVRYLSGLESLTEAAGETRRKDKWSGTLIFRVEP